MKYLTKACIAGLILWLVVGTCRANESDTLDDFLMQFKEAPVKSEPKEPIENHIGLSYNRFGGYCRANYDCPIYAECVNFDAQGRKFYPMNRCFCPKLDGCPAKDSGEL